MFLFILGLIVAMGGVGTLDTNPDANVLLQTFVSVVGCGLMYLGTRTLTGHSYDFD